MAKRRTLVIHCTALAGVLVAVACLPTAASAQGFRSALQHIGFEGGIGRSTFTAARGRRIGIAIRARQALNSTGLFFDGREARTRSVTALMTFRIE